MQRLRCLAVIGVLAVAVSAVAAGPAAAAKGGNSVAAKICQKGGWQNLVPVTGDADEFANQGDCVNDGAQGSPPLGSAGQGVCQGMGGSFRTQRPPTWTCEYTPNGPNPPDDQNSQALKTACGQDGGGFNPSSNPTPGNSSNWLAICFI